MCIRFLQLIYAGPQEFAGLDSDFWRSFALIFFMHDMTRPAQTAASNHKLIGCTDLYRGL